MVSYKLSILFIGYLYLKNENIFEFIEYGEYRNNFSVSPEYAGK